MSISTTLGNLISGLTGQVKKADPLKEEGNASDMADAVGMEKLGQDFSQAFDKALEGRGDGEKLVDSDAIKSAIEPEQETEESLKGLLEEVHENETADFDIDSGSSDLNGVRVVNLESMDASDLTDKNKINKKVIGIEVGLENRGSLESKGGDKSIKLKDVLVDSPQGKALSAELFGVVSSPAQGIQTILDTTLSQAGDFELNVESALISGGEKDWAETQKTNNLITEINQEGVKDPASTLQKNGKDPESFVPSSRVTDVDSSNADLSRNSSVERLERVTEETIDVRQEKTVKPEIGSVKADAKPNRMTLPSTPSLRNTLEEATGVMKMKQPKLEAAFSQESLDLTPLGREQASQAIEQAIQTSSEPAKLALTDVLDKLQQPVKKSTQPFLSVEASPMGSALEVPADSETISSVATSVESESLSVDTPDTLDGSGTKSVSKDSLNITSLTNSMESNLASSPVSSKAGFSIRPLEVGGKDLTGVTSQVIQEATLAVKNGQKEMTLQLTPDDLGTVRIKLNSGADQIVSARLIASTPEAHDILTRQSEALQKALEIQGVRVREIQVVLAGEGTNHHSGGTQSESFQNQSQQQAFHNMAQQYYQEGGDFQGQGQSQSFASQDGEPSDRVRVTSPEEENTELSPNQQATPDDQGRISLLV